MQVKLTYNEIINLNNALHTVGNEKSEPEFSLKVAANIFALKPYIDAIEIARKKPQAILDLDVLRQRAFDKYAVPHAPDNMKVPPDKWEEFRSEIEGLKKQYAKDLEAYEEQIRKFNELLDKYPDIETEVTPIPSECIPKGLSGLEISGIYVLIKN